MRPLLRRGRPYLPLLLIGAAAFVLRLGVIYELRPLCTEDGASGITGECFRVEGDTHYVAIQAEYFADGKGFIDPGPVMYAIGEPERAGAAHPPLYTVLLGLLRKIGIDSIGGWRLFMAAIGSIGVAIIGMAAWRLAAEHLESAGERSRPTAIVATSIAAIHPLLWERDTDLFVESLVVAMMALVVLAALRLWRDQRWQNAALLGLAVGMMWLTRSESVLLLFFMAPLLLAGLRVVSLRKRFVLAGVAGVVTFALMTPWVVYNLGRFENPTFVSTNLGMATLMGSCDATYYGNDFGYWTFECVDPITIDKSRDDSDAQSRHIEASLTYARDHVRRTPLVMAARAGRFWGLYRPGDTVERAGSQEGHGAAAARSGQALTYVLMPLAFAGAWLLRKRRVPISPLVAPFLIATLAATLLIPIPRFRAAADVATIILASVAIEAVRRSLLARRASSTSGSSRACEA